MALISLLAGFIVGVLFCLFLLRMGYIIDVVGNLNLDQSDPYDKPYIFMELHRSTDEVFRKKYVILKTTTRNYMSRK